MKNKKKDVYQDQNLINDPISLQDIYLERANYLLKWRQKLTSMLRQI